MSVTRAPNRPTRNRTLRCASSLVLVAAALGCGSGKNPGAESESGGSTKGTPSASADPSSPVIGDPAAGPATGAAASVESHPLIAGRTVDYGEALRTASLKLVGELPTGEQILSLARAADEAAQKQVYETAVEQMLYDTRFAAQLVRFWRDTFRTGPVPAPPAGAPSFDTAAVFAAQIAFEDRPFTELFTASQGTCPTFSGGVFTSANCPGDGPKAGVLTDPGLMAQYYANMAFRRVRFVQETFACAKFPAEYTDKPTPMGVSLYTSPWEFNSISGGTGSRVDFKDTSSVICANCHTTMNHLAPLFANFDANGNFNPTAVQVETPIASQVAAERITRFTDWLPEGSKLYWRNGVEVADLPALGKAMAADPEVARCAVARVWNWGFSRGDIVSDIATIPPNVTRDLVASFTGGGLKLRSLVRGVFTHPDFVRF